MTDDSAVAIDTGSKRRIDRRRGLIDAAARLFADRGYAHVSVAEIASEAGVTGPTVYRYFTDKQALLSATVLTGIDDLQSYTNVAVADASSASAAREALLECICDLGVRRPLVAQLWRHTSAFLSDEHNIDAGKRTAAVMRQWTQTLMSDRPDLDQHCGRILAWTVLAIGGSLSVHATRIPTGRARARMRILMDRVLTLTPPAIVIANTGTVRATRFTDGRREQILDIASSLFEQRGFGDVSVDEIGESAGITGPSVYRHFSSKSAILVAIARRSATRLDSSVINARAGASTPAEFLRALVDSYVDVLTDTPDLSVAFANRAGLTGTDADDLLAAQRDYVARWSSLLIDIEPGLASPEAAISVHAALCIANDAIALRGRDRINLAELLAYLMKGVLGL